MGDRTNVSPLLSRSKEKKDIISKYLGKPSSSQLFGSNFNPYHAKKQKIALSIELKRNAQKIGKYIKESEIVSKLVKTQIDSEDITSQFFEPKLTSRQEQLSPLKDFDLSLNSHRRERAPIIVRADQSPTSKDVAKALRTEISPQNAITARSSSRRDDALPGLLPKELSPPSLKLDKLFSVKEIRESFQKADQSKELRVKEAQNSLLLKPNVVSTAESPTKLNTALINSALKNFLRKYAYKQKENPVDKFHNASRSYSKKDLKGEQSKSPPPKTLATEPDVHAIESINMIRFHSLERSKTQSQVGIQDSHIENRNKKRILPPLDIPMGRRIKETPALSSKRQENEEIAKSINKLKNLYKSCNKLVSNLNSIDKKLNNKEAKMNNLYSDLQQKLEKIKESHFLPEEMLLNQGF